MPNHPETSTPPPLVPCLLLSAITRRLLHVNMAKVFQSNIRRSDVLIATLAEYNTFNYHKMGSVSLPNFCVDKFCFTKQGIQN